MSGFPSSNPVEAVQSGLVLLTSKCVGAGSSDPTGQEGDASVARSGAGTYVLTFPGRSLDVRLVAASIEQAATKNLQATATYDEAAKTVTVNVRDMTRPTPAWLTGETVTSDAWTASEAGWVVAVEATTGSVTGVCTIQESGSPATTTCSVAYTSGVPTVTFNAGTDAVTEASILFIPRDDPAGADTDLTTAEDLLVTVVAKV